MNLMLGETVTEHTRKEYCKSQAAPALLLAARIHFAFAFGFIYAGWEIGAFFGFQLSAASAHSIHPFHE